MQLLTKYLSVFLINKFGCMRSSRSCCLAIITITLASSTFGQITSITVSPNQRVAVGSTPLFTTNPPNLPASIYYYQGTDFNVATKTPPTIAGDYNVLVTPDVSGPSVTGNSRQSALYNYEYDNDGSWRSWLSGTATKPWPTAIRTSNGAVFEEFHRLTTRSELYVGSVGVPVEVIYRHNTVSVPSLERLSHSFSSGTASVFTGTGGVYLIAGKGTITVVPAPAVVITTEVFPQNGGTATGGGAVSLDRHTDPTAALPSGLESLGFGENTWKPFAFLAPDVREKNSGKIFSTRGPRPSLPGNQALGASFGTYLDGLYELNRYATAYEVIIYSGFAGGSRGAVYYLTKLNGTILTATAGPGFTFVNWTLTSGAGTIVSPNSSVTKFLLASPEVNATVRANFTSGNSGPPTTPVGSTITFATPPPQLFVGTPGTVPLVASASSGLPVSFSMIGGAASLSGSSVTFTRPGWVTVRASQAGDANFLPAPDVQVTFPVNLQVKVNSVAFPDPSQAIWFTPSDTATKTYIVSP